ncbi:MAG: sigma-54-dependent transcriptional regulator [Bacteroidota bacterium]
MADRILVVDDEKIIRESLSFILEKEGYDVSEAANGVEALKQLKQKPVDIVLTDLEMPEMKGIELLERVTRQFPETFVIIITAYGSLETAIAALRNGAFDYILKPIEFDDVLHRIRRLIEHRRLARENTLLRQELHQQYDFDAIIGKSAAMLDVFDTIKKVSQTDRTVLITGKSGTGKELVARAIHFNGRRKQNRFVAVNCGAIVETLFESELFGHKKGSFTGATADRDGLFKAAHEGTLFLDEVSEIPIHLQVKLLRAIEQKEIIPVGMTDPIQVDVRIIASTNKNLYGLMEEKKFRDDLYYRLNVVEIHLPSLTERPEDIPPLLQHFVQHYRAQMIKNVRGLTNDAVNALMRYQWKGEVRELQNIIERAMIFCEEEYIGLEHLPEHVRSAVTDGDALRFHTGSLLKDAVKDFEKQYIKRTLEQCQNDKEKTAKLLGIGLSSLYRKMDELGFS